MGHGSGKGSHSREKEHRRDKVVKQCYGRHNRERTERAEIRNITVVNWESGIIGTPVELR